MFENLSERLQKVVSNIKSKGVINEDNISEITREIRLCLLEADVNVKIVREFIDSVKEKALGEEVRKSIKPGDMFVKILKDELVSLLGGDSAPLVVNKNPTICMVVGLQGGGKTTTIGKIGNMVRKKHHKKPMFIACDVYRPAAIDQLKDIGKQLNIEVYEEGKGNPVEISKRGIEYAKSKGYDYILIDCPAGIEQGFKNAIAGASRAIVVTTAEISAIRDADRIIGLLEASEIKNPELVINRLRPNMVKKGEMMEVEDIVDLLSIDLIGVVPDDEFIITQTNKGEPVVTNHKAPSGKAYTEIASRILGENVEITIPGKKEGFLEKIKNFFTK